MGNINDLLQRKLDARDSGNMQQSKSSSLVMNALKSSMAIILDVRAKHQTEEDFMNGVAASIKHTYAKQGEIVEKVKIVAGGFTENESYVWRRAFYIAAANALKEKSPHENVVLAILSNTEQAKAICARLGLDQSELTNLIANVSSYNLYSEANTFFSSTQSSIMKAGARIEAALSKFEFGTSEQYAKDIAVKACTLSVIDLMELCPDLVSNKQKVMFQKSCIGHAAKLTSTALNNVGIKWDYHINDFDISDFEEQFMSELDLLKNCLKYCANRVRESLSAFEEQHEETPLVAGRTEFGVSDLLNAIDSVQSILPHEDKEVSAAVFAQQFVNTLKTADFFTQYLTNNIDTYITSIAGESAKSFAYNTIYTALLEPIRNIHFGDLNLDERYLKMCANIAIYLISEQPAVNSALNENGLLSEDITAFRQERDIAFAIGVNSAFQNRQVIIPAAAELTKAYAATLSFNWGINLAYIAPHIAKAILMVTNRLYLEMAPKVVATNTSLFRACLSRATDCFVQTWQTEAEKTLEHSKQRYTRGDISQADSEQIVKTILARYVTASYEQSHASAMLTDYLHDMINFSDTANPVASTDVNLETLLQ